MDSNSFVDDLNNLTKAPGINSVLSINEATLIVIIDVRIFFQLVKFFIQRKIFNPNMILNLHWYINLFCINSQGLTIL